MYGASQPDNRYLLVHAPFSLTPVPFPRESFVAAKAVATSFNYMIDAVSRDSEYLTHVLADAAEEDEFVVRVCICLVW